MAEINLEMTKSGSSNFPLLTRLEMEALIYVIRKLARALELSGEEKDER